MLLAAQWVFELQLSCLSSSVGRASAQYVVCHRFESYREAAREKRNCLWLVSLMFTRASFVQLMGTL